MQYRYGDSDIVRIEKVLNTPRHTLTAPAGTLILFNSSTVHRGSPIKKGNRISFTNYYFPLSRGYKSLIAQFTPVLSPLDA